MRKVMIKVMCVVMMLSMMTLFTGCSEQDKFVGTWEAKVNMADYFNEGLGDDEEMAEYLSVDDFSLVLVMIFNDDGTYKMTVDEDAAKESFSTLKTDLTDGMKKYFEALIEQQGLNMSVDDVLALSGTTLDGMMEQILGDEVIEELISEMSSEGNFKVADGKLYLSEGLDYAVDETIYDTYEISGNTLKLIESVGSDDEESLAELYPIEFTKTK